MLNERYLAVSDESGTDGDNRYQALGFVCGPRLEVAKLNHDCKRIVSQFGVSEVKSTELVHSKKYGAALEMLRTVFANPQLRVMVMTWDTHDSRHAIQNRDDNAKMHRMLYHSLRAICDWHHQIMWDWVHDENNSLNWEDVQYHLNLTTELKRVEKHPTIVEPNRQKLLFASAKTRCSKAEPIIGVADLFAGLVRHSVENADSIIKAVQNTKGQPALAEIYEEQPLAFDSRKAEAKARLGTEIYELGKQGKHGISLHTYNRFQTHHNRGRFWFWHYVPQSEYDKAPTKIGLA